MKVWRILCVIFLAASLLSGCVKYDAGINFEGQTHGEIVQHIKLGDRLTSFSSETVQEWLNSIDRRAKSLQGRTKRLSGQEVVVTIPFYNGAELEEKFNQFFNPADPKRGKAANTSVTELPNFASHLTVRQNNFLLVLRNRITLELDLRSLSLLSSNGSVLVSPGALLELAFSLNTPWGAQSVSSLPTAIPATSLNEGQQLVWQLKPGEINYLEAVFWLPSPVGIGAALIALFVAAGFYLKYKLLPALGFGKKKQQSLAS